jgi:PBP1b-binding outer membrane lipoprotein LpoB
MRTLKIVSVVAAGLVLLTSCAGMAKIEKDDTVDFSKYQTFAWADDVINDSSFHTELQDRNLHATVNKELSKSNIREEKAKPDILLKHDMLVEKKVKQNNKPVYSRSYTQPYFNPYTRRWNYIYHPSRLIGYDRSQYAVKEATLTLSVIDAKTDKVVWQGWTTGQVANSNVTSKELEKSVKTILKKFNTAK